MTWGRVDHAVDARERLLDAAGAVFARKGVVDVTVADVAAEAGCARGTVYRCFPDRDALRIAFVEREARRVAARVQARLDLATSPAELVVAATLAAVDEVRADPVLVAWFDDASATTAGHVAVGTALIAGLIRSFLDDLDRDLDSIALADGVMRLVLSLLAVPAPGSPAVRDRAERRLVEALLVPALSAGPAAAAPPLVPAGRGSGQ